MKHLDPQIEFVKVESSNLEAIGYLDGKLYVKYKTGTCYAYKDVCRATFLEMLGCRSKGQYLNEKIKPGFSFEKIY